MVNCEGGTIVAGGFHETLWCDPTPEPVKTEISCCCLDGYDDGIESLGLDEIGLLNCDCGNWGKCLTD